MLKKKITYACTRTTAYSVGVNTFIIQRIILGVRTWRQQQAHHSVHAGMHLSHSRPQMDIIIPFFFARANGSMPFT